jgi:hypothetical protein
VSRPACAYCGKRYGSRDIEMVTKIVPVGEPLEYKTNGKIVKHSQYQTLRKPDGSPPDASRTGMMNIQQLIEDKSLIPFDCHNISVWDGESYSTPYKPFCTLRCSLNFATAAHRAGYRVKET